MKSSVLSVRKKQCLKWCAMIDVPEMYVGNMEGDGWMSVCRECDYAERSTWERDGKNFDITCCVLTNYVVKANEEGKCSFFNKDLSGYDICYNCNYYRGGSDWGLFCAHKENYHHLGQFNDKPCEYYEKRKKDGSTDGG